MKITDIKQQVKREGRYSIFVDGKYSFSLSENELLDSGIRVNNEYTNQEFEDLKQRAVLDKAYMRSLDLLARRPRSEWEMETYLKRKDYDVSVIKQTLKHLSDRGLINDQAFAKSWVDNRRLLKSTSKQRLKLELRQKRVPSDVIDTVLNEDETDEREVLKELIEKKQKQTRYHDKDKLMQYLLRQGFQYQDVRDILKR